MFSNVEFMITYLSKGYIKKYIKKPKPLSLKFFLHAITLNEYNQGKMRLCFVFN